MEHWEEEAKIRKSFYFELPLWILSAIHVFMLGISSDTFFLFAGLILITIEDLIEEQKGKTDKKRKFKIGYTIVILTLIIGVCKYFYYVNLN